MVDRQVEFLDAERLVVRHADRDVSEIAALDLAARLARQRDRADALDLGHLQGVDDIRRIARGRDGEQDIARVAHAEELLGKREVRCLVVGEGRVECDLIDHRERRQGALQILHEVVGLLRADGAHLLLHIRTELARQQEALHELADDVLGIRGTAAIAAGDELVAACIALADGLDRRDEVIAADGEDGITRDEVVDLRERRCFCHWVHFFLNMGYRPTGSAS